MRLAGTDRDLLDFTRWNRAGLDRITYAAEAGAEFAEYLRLAHLLLYSDAASTPPIEDWREGFRTGTMPDTRPLQQALNTLASRFPRQQMDGTTATGASYADRLMAQYTAPLTDPSAQIARAFVRALHVLSETLSAYANEGLLRTATQPAHLAALLSYIGYRPRFAASASMPIALLLKPDAGRIDLAAGIAVEHVRAGGKGTLTFETLSPLTCHPTLNALRLAGWDQATTAIATTATAFTLTTATAFSRTLPGTTAILIDGASMESARITAADRAAQTVTLLRQSATKLTGTWQAAHLLTSPRLALRLRPRGNDWLNFAEVQQVAVGEVLAVDIGTTDHVRVRVTDMAGRDVRVAPLTGTPSLANRRVVYRTRTQHTFSIPTTGTAPPTVTATTYPLSDRLGPLVTLSATSVYVEGAEARSLTEGQPVALLTASGVGRAVPLTGALADGDGIILSVGSDAPGYSTLAADFQVDSMLAADWRSTAPAMTSTGLLSLLVGEDTADLLVPGRALLITSDPAVTAPENAVAAFAHITRIDSRSATLTTVALDIPVSALDGLTLGATLVHANTALFGHGKALPPRVLGSGDAGNPSPRLHITESPVATRANPAFPGGIAPDIEITVDGRVWQLQSPDAPPPANAAQDLPSFTLQQADDGGLDVIFNRRLPSGADNVRLTRIRLGAGEAGNDVPPFAITNLKPRLPSVEAVVQPMAPQSGADLETADQIRRTGGTNFALMGRALAVDDFARLAETHAGIWHAHARLGRGAGRGGIWLTIVPSDGTELDLVAPDLTAMLTARAMPGTALTILPFTPAPFGLAATVRLRPGYADQSAIETDLRAQLLDRFGLKSQGLGTALYTAQVVALIESHPAVDNVSLTLTPLWPAPGPRTDLSSSGEIEAIRPDPVTATYIADAGDILLTVQPSVIGGTP
jgi:hypothetical protein